MLCVEEEHIEGHEGNDGQQQLSQHLAPHAVAVAEAAVVLGFQRRNHLRLLLGYLFAFAHYVVACHHQLAAVAQLRQAALQFHGRAVAVQVEAGDKDAVAQQPGLQVVRRNVFAHMVFASEIAFEYHHSAPGRGVPVGL